MAFPGGRAAESRDTACGGDAMMDQIYGISRCEHGYARIESEYGMREMKVNHVASDTIAYIKPYITHIQVGLSGKVLIRLWSRLTTTRTTVRRSSKVQG